MTGDTTYTPGPARDARIDKRGDTWTLVLTRELRHSPEKVWESLTDPSHLRDWAPFDADRKLDKAGVTAKLTTVGAPTPHVTETTVLRAEAPKLLEFNWGGQEIRWQLEAAASGTRLTLWHNIDKRYIAMGAAGWHLCIDVMDHALRGTPLGRSVGPDAMKVPGWKELMGGYVQLLGRE